MQDELTNQMQRLCLRVRVAVAPDRDLDAEISWRTAPDVPGAGAGVWAARNSEPDLSGAAVFSGLFPDWRTRDDVVPRYTGSVDAALGLAGDQAEDALRHALSHRRPGSALTASLALGVVEYVLERS